MNLKVTLAVNLEGNSGSKLEHDSKLAGNSGSKLDGALHEHYI